MTNEEAIAIISRPFDMSGVPSEVLDAHKMAVEALEQEPKTGHWKSTIDGKPICSECGFISESLDGYFVSNYCPNCGCRMFEPQEREDNDKV